MMVRVSMSVSVRYQCDAICICTLCAPLYMYMYRRYQCDPGAVDTEFYSCGDSAACAGPDAWLHDCPPCPTKVCVGCI